MKERVNDHDVCNQESGHIVCLSGVSVDRQNQWRSNAPAGPVAVGSVG